MEPSYNIMLSNDRMTVTLTAPAGSDVYPATVIAALKAMHLAAFDDGVVIEALQSRETPISVVVSQGTPAIDESQPPFHYRVPVCEGAAATVSRIEPGQVVATFAAAGTAAVDGRDVFGTVVPAMRRSAQLGRNLAIVGSEIVASKRGNLRMFQERLSVEPLLELSDDRLAPELAQFDGDVFFKGSFSRRTPFNITGSMTVTGALEAIQLITGGPVFVQGGIIGKPTSHCTIGGDLRCRYISGGTLAINGNLEALSEIANARVACTGGICAPRGAIYGGEFTANNTITCRTLGHIAGATTIIEAGEGAAARRQFLAYQVSIEANRKKVADVRKKIEPLLRIMKQLTPQQRERATELLAEADDLEGQTEEMEASLRTLLDTMNKGTASQINVDEVLHAGVHIRMGNLEANISMAFKGPLLLTTKKFGNSTELILQETGGKSPATTILPSHPLTAQETKSISPRRVAA